MARRFSKKSQVKLDEKERELFLNAFYQGVLPKKKTDASKKNKPVLAQKSAVESENDSDLFLRAIEEGFSGEHFKYEKVKNPTKSTKRKHSALDATIDLHGLTVEDALLGLSRFIEQEKQRGSKTLLVIHGKGTGALKSAVLSFIDESSVVNDYQGAPRHLGGEGAVLIRINRSFKRADYGHKS